MKTLVGTPDPEDEGRPDQVVWVVTSMGATPGCGGIRVPAELSNGFDLSWGGWGVVTNMTSSGSTWSVQWSAS